MKSNAHKTPKGVAPLSLRRAAPFTHKGGGLLPSFSPLVTGGRKGENKEHLTIEGLIKLLAIKGSMNLGFPSSCCHCCAGGQQEGSL